MTEQFKDPTDPQNESRSKAQSWKKYGWMLLVTFKWLIIIGIIFGFMAAGIVTGYVGALVKDETVRSKKEIMDKISESTYTGFVYFKDDTVVGQLRSEEDHRPADWDEIPEVVKNAFLAVEDDNFYQHHGVDINGLGRAVMQKLKHEDVQTGGSTITQQLARRVFLNLDRTDSRKFKEIFLSLRLERFLGKEEIFASYMNKIPYGNGSSGYNLYGIKAAVKGIFGLNDMNQLNIAQAAYLAGLPQSPTTYSAFTGKGEFDPEGFKLAMKRQELVLKRMLETGRITAPQYDEASRFDLKASLAKPEKKAYDTYPYLMLEAEREAAIKLLQLQNPKLTEEDLRKKEYADQLKDARDALLRGGYKIYTTIDETIYDSMKEIAAEPKNFTPDHPKKGVEQIGAVMIDNKTGAILGMMEGRDFYKEQLNHATQMLRQPGSTMKTVAAYLPALENGSVSPATPLDDIPIILQDGSKGYHLPHNWNSRYQGLVTARQAVVQSLNIPAIRVFLNDVKINNAWDFAKKLGISSLQKEDYTAQTGVIGGLKYGVSVKELTGAYASIPNKGVFNDPYFIRKIEDMNGRVVYEHQIKPTTVYSEQTAYMMTDMLKSVITDPGGTAHDLMTRFKGYSKVPVAGKTGSTQDDVDAWFMGYSPDITVGVWAGYDKPATLIKGSGTIRAKTVWAQIMDAALAKKPELFKAKQFDKPDNIVELTVSNVSGKLPSELVTQSNRTVTDIFNKKFIPTEEDDKLFKAKTIMYQGKAYIPQPGTPDDMVQEKLAVKRDPPISDLMKQIEQIMQKLPEDKREPVDSFMPEDDMGDVPKEVDPRKDDGAAPAPPSKLSISASGGEIKGAFLFSPSSDTIGYRIYRSVNHGPFQRLKGKVVLYGGDNHFTDQPPAGGVYGYYLTAVDVAGRESEPSNAAFTDGSSQTPPSDSSGGLTSPYGPLPGSGGSNGGGTIGDGQTTAKKPASPSGLMLETIPLGVRMKWTANGAADAVTEYRVYYSDQAGGPFRRILTATDPSADYTALQREGWYRLSAVNKAGESPLSPPVQYTE